MFHFCKCVIKVLNKYSITDGFDRASLGTIGSIVLAECESGGNIASLLPRNILGHWDVQSDNTAWRLSMVFALLPDWSSHTGWPEQIRHYSAIAKEQPCRDEFFPVGMAVTRIGFLLVCDSQGHRVFKIQQENVWKMNVLAGCGAAGPSSSKAEKRLSCNFNTPSSILLVRDDHSPKSQEHAVIVDHGNNCLRVIENAGAVRLASTGCVHSVALPNAWQLASMGRLFSIASVTTAETSVWPWRLVGSAKTSSSVHVLQLSKDGGVYHLSILTSISCGPASLVFGLAVHTDMIAVACRDKVFILSLSCAQVDGLLDYDDARGVAFNARGELLVTDASRHTVDTWNVLDTKNCTIISTWGKRGVPGNTDGPPDTTLFAVPVFVCCEGNTAFVVCEGSAEIKDGHSHGSRIAVCSSTSFLRQFLRHLYLLYVMLEFHGRPVRLPAWCEQLLEVPPANLDDGLRRLGWPAMRFFTQCVNVRELATGRKLRSATC